MVITRRPQSLHRHFVELRHLVFTWHSPSAVSSPALQQLLPKPAAFINLQQINRSVLWLEPRQFIQRLPPALSCLVRQSSDQIEADVSNACLTQNRHGPVNICAPMHPSRSHYFFFLKRFHPKSYPV